MTTLIKPAEMAQRLHISPQYLRELSASGTVPCSAKTPGGHRRYTDQDFEVAQAALAGSRFCATQDQIMELVQHLGEAAYHPQESGSLTHLASLLREQPAATSAVRAWARGELQEIAAEQQELNIELRGQHEAFHFLQRAWRDKVQSSESRCRILRLVSLGFYTAADSARLERGYLQSVSVLADTDSHEDRLTRAAANMLVPRTVNEISMQLGLERSKRVIELLVAASSLMARHHCAVQVAGIVDEYSALGKYSATVA